MSKQDILQYAEEHGYDKAMDLMESIGSDGFDGTTNEYNILYDDIMEAHYNTGRQ